jgi:hypothetical protein
MYWHTGENRWYVKSKKVPDAPLLSLDQINTVFGADIKTEKEAFNFYNFLFLVMTREYLKDGVWYLRGTSKSKENEEMVLDQLAEGYTFTKNIPEIANAIKNATTKKLINEFFINIMIIGSVMDKSGEWVFVRNEDGRIADLPLALLGEGYSTITSLTNLQNYIRSVVNEDGSIDYKELTMLMQKVFIIRKMYFKEKNGKFNLSFREQIPLSALTFDEALGTIEKDLPNLLEMLEETVDKVTGEMDETKANVAFNMFHFSVTRVKRVGDKYMVVRPGGDK